MSENQGDWHGASIVAFLQLEVCRDDLLFLDEVLGKDQIHSLESFALSKELVMWRVEYAHKLRQRIHHVLNPKLPPLPEEKT